MNESESLFLIRMMHRIMQSGSNDVEIMLQILEMIKLRQRQRISTTTISPSPTKNPSTFEQRLNWEVFASIQKEQSTNFRRHLRMSKESFTKLLGFIKPSLTVDERMASIRGGQIIPELCLYCTIRWLAGGSYSDIFYFCGISKTSFYRIIWKSMKAIAKCRDDYIKITFPKTLEQCQKVAAGFASVSTMGCIKECVAAVDGYLLAINAPSKKQGKNVRSFFSGHYQKYGVNVQAACDHHSRFTFIALAGPGVMGDREACRECNLYDLIENLPGNFCAIGDCAYKPTPVHMVPVYGGNLAKLKENDTFNFFASQLRIRIEMAFGMMVKKWGILQRPVSVPLKKLK
jgi:hypothetical protein